MAHPFRGDDLMWRERHNTPNVYLPKTETRVWERVRHSFDGGVKIHEKRLTMPLSIRCKFEGDLLGIGKALEIRDRVRPGSRPKFMCIQCGKPVRAHKAGTTGQGAHFEHLERNPRCSLSAAVR